MDEERPRLLLLHGVLSGPATWRLVREELGGSVVTLAPALPGNGDSAAPPAPYGLDAIVEQLLPLVERYRPTHVVGHSMGGIVALGLRARLPDAFERTGVIGLPVYPDRETAIRYLAARGRFVRGVLRDHRRAHVLCAVARSMGPLWPAALHRRFPALPPDVLRATFDHQSVAHGRAIEEVVFADLVPGLAKKEGTGIALLHGNRDRAAPLDRAKELADELGLDFTGLPGATHQVAIEQPQVVAEWIEGTVIGRSREAGAG